MSGDNLDVTAWGGGVPGIWRYVPKILLNILPWEGQPFTTPAPEKELSGPKCH